MVVWDPWNSSVSVSSFDLGLQQMAALPSSKTSLQSIPRFILRTHQHDGGFTYSLTHSWDILGPWDYFPWNIILFKTYFPWFMNYPHYIVSPFFHNHQGTHDLLLMIRKIFPLCAAQRSDKVSPHACVKFVSAIGSDDALLSSQNLGIDISDSNLSSPISIAIGSMVLVYIY